MLELLALAALIGAVPTSPAAVALAPVAPSVIAADTVACLKHMSMQGLDRAGLEADGWKRYRPSDLRARHFIESVTIYADGDGVALGYDGALGAHAGCTLVALPTPSPDFGQIADQISAKLEAHPVFQKAGSILWAPNGPDEVLVMLTKDPERPDLVDVVMRAPLQPAKHVDAPAGQQG